MLITPPFKKKNLGCFKWVPKDEAEISSLFLHPPLVVPGRAAKGKGMQGMWIIH